jgi:hypothetical protein
MSSSPLEPLQHILQEADLNGLGQTLPLLIKLTPDNIIHESAETYREWERVPDDRKWSDVRSAGWQDLFRGCFKVKGSSRPVSY